MPSISAKEYREAQRKGKSLDELVREAEAKEKRERREEKQREAERKAETGDLFGDDPSEDPPPNGDPTSNLGLVRTRHVREVLVKTFDVNPVGKPRQTRSDKWKKRPCVMRYRAYADAVREQAEGWHVPEHSFRLVFYVEAPKTKQERDGDPHHLKPDIDNLTKAFFDALEDEDKYIWDCRTTAYWTKMNQGKIEVWEIHEADSIDS